MRSLDPSPMVLPVSLTSDNLFETIGNNKQNYLVARKADGVRYLLVLTTTKESGDVVAMMVNRAFEMYEVSVAAPHSTFRNGLVVDGELVWDTYSSFHPPRQLYQVFDILWHPECHQRCQNDDYVERLRKLGKLFGPSDVVTGNDAMDSATDRGSDEMQLSVSEWRVRSETRARKGCVASNGNEHNIAFVVKPAHPVQNLGSLVRTCDTVTWPTDGYVFTPISAPVKRGRHTEMFKWKACHTLDVTLQLQQCCTPEATADEHNRSCAIAGWNISVLLWDSTAIDRCDMPLDNRLGSAMSIWENRYLLSMLHHLESKGFTQHEVLVECEVIAEEKENTNPNRHFQLFVVNLRTDKKLPNSFTTARRTFANVAENISEKMLLECICSNTERSKVESHLEMTNSDCCVVDRR